MEYLNESIKDWTEQKGEEKRQRYDKMPRYQESVTLDNTLRCGCIGERDCRKCGKHFTGTCLCLTFLCNDCYTDAENRVISPAGGSGCLPGLLNSTLWKEDGTVDLIWGPVADFPEFFTPSPKPTYEELAQAVKDKCFQLYDNATCSEACIYCEKEDWKDGPPHEENCIVTRLTKGKE